MDCRTVRLRTACVVHACRCAGSQRHRTVARKDRHSADWYIGAATDEAARSLGVTLDFLDPGKTYIAQIDRDGLGADRRADTRHAITIETKRVKRGDTLTLAMGPGGGEAIRFVETKGRR